MQRHEYRVDVSFVQKTPFENFGNSYEQFSASGENLKVVWNEPSTSFTITGTVTGGPVGLRQAEDSPFQEFFSDPEAQGEWEVIMTGSSFRDTSNDWHGYIQSTMSVKLYPLFESSLIIKARPITFSSHIFVNVFSGSSASNSPTAWFLSEFSRVGSETCDERLSSWEALTRELESQA